MNVLLTGGTGLIGKALTNKLTKKKYHVYIVTRTPQKFKDRKKISYISYKFSPENLPPIDLVINLAGESIFGRWTKQKKERILQSRLQTTEKLFHTIKNMKHKPKVFITASAVGFYGHSNDQLFTEQTKQAGNGFLADVIEQWEEKAQQIESLGIRTIYARFGVILSNKGGAFPLMKLPVQLFIGGKIGRGTQGISWIHIQDCIGLLLFAIENEDIAGILNITAPKPVQNKLFIKKIAKKLQRPAIIPTPSFLVRAALGEMSELIIKGQYVLPQKAIDHNYEYSYPYIHLALQHLLTK